MVSRLRGSIALALLSVGMVAGSATAALVMTPPTWPQSFKIGAGGRASFAFPVTQPGDLTVTVTWSGAPLSVVLTDPSGAAVDRATPQNSPVKITRRVTAADVAKGLLWGAVIADPSKPGSSTLSCAGAVTAQYPPVDQAALAKWLPAFTSSRLAARKTEQSRLTAQTAQDEKARLARIAQDQKNASAAQDARFADQVKAYQLKLSTDMAAARASIRRKIVPVTTRSAVVSAGAPKPSTGVRSGATSAIGTIRNVEKLKTPKLTGLLPGQTGQGYAGDEVGVYADDLQGTNPAVYQAVFTVGKNLTAIGQVTRMDAGSDKPYLVVKVPEEPSNCTASYSGPLIVNRVEPTDGTVLCSSNSLAFTYMVRYRPQIDSVSPVNVLPADVISIAGSHFGQTCKTHFIFPDGRHEIVENRDDSTKTIRVSMPVFHTHTPFPVVMYVEKEDHGRLVRSDLKDLTAECDQIWLTSLEPAEASRGESILFTGICLDKVYQVLFQPDPGQEGLIFNQTDSGWCDFRKPWYPIKQSQTPSYMRVDAEGGGIIAPIHGKVVVAVPPSDGTNSLPFTLKPDTDTYPIFERYSVSGTIFSKKDDGDQFSQMRYPENKGLGDDRWILAEHHSGYVSGHAGDDTYVMDCVLKNGWSLATTGFCTSGGEGQNHGSRLESAYIDGNGHPVFKVHWWVDASCNAEYYSIIPYITGFWCVPYK